MEEFWTQIPPRSIIDEIMAGEGILEEPAPRRRSGPRLPRTRVSNQGETGADKTDISSCVQNRKIAHSVQLFRKGF